jgi:hypothetical protein
MGYQLVEPPTLFDTVIDRLLWEMQVPKLEISTKFSTKEKCVQRKVTQWTEGSSAGALYLINAGRLPANGGGPPPTEIKYLAVS